MKKIIVFWIIILSVSFSFAQNLDSLIVVKTKWEKEKLAPGVVLKKYHFKDKKQLFGTPQYLSVIEIDTRKAPYYISFQADSIFRKTSDFAEKYNAIVAINGNFFSWNTKNAVDYLKIKGKKIAENIREDGKRKEHQMGSIMLDTIGILTIEKVDTSDANWEDKQIAYQMMNSGPLLLKNGQREQLDINSSLVKVRHPRTALATSKDGRKIYFIVVDGRAKNNAYGLSLVELASVLKWIGAEDAINLDGGGSSAMYARKTKENKGKIVNHPCDNRQFDNQGERAVSNVIMLVEK